MNKPMTKKEWMEWLEKAWAEASSMTDDKLIEIAIQGHASTRDAIRYAIKCEREACAKVCDELDRRWINQAEKCAERIRARGE